MGGCFAEAGYLASIVLLEQGITSPEKAISGLDIIEYIKAKAPAYFNYLGEEKLKRRLLVPLQLAGCPYDLEHLLSQDSSYADLARDTPIDPDDPRISYPAILYTSKYWMHNGDKKGTSFRGGMAEEHLANYFRETKPDQKWYAIETMAEIKNDTDLWAYVNTWLSKSWRT
jgi:hypothetical protein